MEGRQSEHAGTGLGAFSGRSGVARPIEFREIKVSVSDTVLTNRRSVLNFELGGPC